MKLCITSIMQTIELFRSWKTHSLRLVTTFLSKSLATASLSILSTPALAVEQYHQSTVYALSPLANGDFIVQFNVQSPQCSSPAAPYKYMYVVVGQNGMTIEGAKKMYAAVLSAWALGKLVTLAFDDGTTYCYINRMGVL